MKSLFLVLGLFLLFGCLGGQDETPIQSNDATPTDDMATESVEMYSMTEVAKHTTPDDCWIVLDEKVYDVSNFGEKHGGGEAVYQGCGIDATQLFETRPMGSGTPHSAKARSFKPNFEIGVLAN